MNHTSTFPETLTSLQLGMFSGMSALLSSEFPVGTGGSRTIECLRSRGHQEYWVLVIDPGSSVEVPVGPMTTAGDLDLVRKALCLTVVDIARSLNVTRQAVYAWLDGGPISTGNRKKIEDLVQAANVISEAGIGVTRWHMQRAITSGMNLVDVVAAGGSAVAAAHDLVGIIQTEIRQRARLSSRLAKRAPPEPGSYRDLGAPMLNETE